MLRHLVLLALTIIIAFSVVIAVPFKDHSSEPTPGWGWGPPPLHGGGGWGWGERPAYDINPHFGFRQYSEMRYEPLTAPYVYSSQLAGAPAPPQPLVPLLKGEGPPYSPNLPGPIKSVGILDAAHNAYTNPSYQSYGGGDGYTT